MDKPMWLSQELWNDLDDETKTLCVEDPKAAKAALGINGDAMPTVEIARAGRPPDAKQLLDLLAPKISERTREAFVKEIDANEEHRQVRLRNWVIFQKDFGMDLEALPNSGSERTENTNIPFDIYKWSEARKRGEGTKEMEGSVLDDLHDEVIGLALTQTISALEQRTKDATEGKSVKVQAELARQRNRRSTGRKYVHEAVEFGKQWAAFRPLKFVGVRFMPAIDLKAGDGTLDKDGYVNLANVNKGPDCLQIFVKLEGGGEDDHRKISVGTFLKYKVQKAIDNAGGADKVSLTNIIETVPKKKRGARTPDTGEVEDENEVVIKNVPQFESAVAELAALAEDTGFMGHLYTFLNKRDKDGDYVNDDALASIFATARMFDEVCSRPEYRDRYKKFAASNSKAAA